MLRLFMLMILVASWCLLAVSKGFASPSMALEFFVAPDGRDANPGTRERPFASLGAARDAMRARREGEAPRGPVTVWIRGGFYPRSQTFKLEKNDGGTATAPVVYRAHGDEKVRLAGGRMLETSWCVPVRDAEVLERLDETVRDKILQVDLRDRGITEYGEMSILAPMLELFHAGRRLPLARWPNEGYAPIGKVVEVADDGARQLVDGNRQGKAFQYQGDRPGRWSRAHDLVLHGFWWFGWMDQHVGIENIDTTKKEITLQSVPGGGIRKNQWFCALNLLEEIDMPGEWYLDRSRGMLYLYPPANLSSGELMVSTLTEPLIVLENTAHVTIRGLTIEVMRGVGLVIGGGTHNRFAGCTIRGVGSDAVVIDHGDNNGLLGCDLHDIGGTAVRITGGNRSTLQPASNYVTNCHIFRFAQRKKVYRPAVRMYGVGHRVTHNLIHDAPHQALAYDGNEHRLEFNEIHHVVLESSDAGVIYTGRDWTFRGNIVRHNFIHHIPHGPGLGTVGVYLDDCVSSTAIIGNVFYDMLKPAFIGGGRDNRVVNNIFIECDTPVYMDSRGLRWDHFRPGGPMEKNLKRVPYDRPPWSTRYPELARILDEIPRAPLGNVIARNISVRSSWRDPEKYCRDTSEKNIERKYARQEHNYITDEDPGFVDGKAMNFKLRKDAAVLEKVPGFEPIPFEKIGLYKDEFRVHMPEK